MKLIIFVLFFFFSTIALGQRVKGAEPLGLQELESNDAKAELRIYEIDMFSDVLVSVYQIHFSPDKTYFSLPKRIKSKSFNYVDVNKFKAPNQFASVFRFNEWLADYESLVTDGVHYTLEYNWQG